MKIKDLKALSTEELKEKVAQEGVEFLRTLDLSEVIDLLANKKVWSPVIEKSLVKTTKDAEITANVMLEQKFVPSVSIAQKLLDESKDEALLVKVVKALNNYQFPKESLIQASNNKQHELFLTLWMTCVKSRDSRLLAPYAHRTDGEFERVVAEALIADGSPDSELAQAVKRTLQYRDSFSALLIDACSKAEVTLNSGRQGPPRKSYYDRDNAPKKFEGTIVDAFNLGIVNRFPDGSMSYVEGIENVVRYAHYAIHFISLLNPKTIPKGSSLYELFNPPNGSHKFHDSTIYVAENLAYNGMLKDKVQAYLMSILKFGKAEGAFPRAMECLSKKYISGQRGLVLEVSEVLDLDEKIESMKKHKECGPLVTRLLPKREKGSNPAAKRVFFTEMLQALYSGGYAAMEAIEKDTGYSIDQFVTDSRQKSKNVDTLYRNSLQKAIPVEKLPVFEDANEHLKKDIAHKISERSEISDSVYKKAQTLIKNAYGSTVARVLSEKSLIDYCDGDLDELVNIITIRKKVGLSVEDLTKEILKLIKNPRSFRNDRYSSSSLEDYEKAGILELLSSKDIKTLLKNLGDSGSKALVTATDKDGNLAFSDEELCERLTGSTGRINQYMLEQVKKSRKKLFGLVKAAYVEKDKKFFGGRLVQEKDVLESCFNVKVEVKEKKVSSNPERTALMARIRNEKWLSMSDFPLLKQIYEEKPQYFEDKVLRLNDELKDSFRKLTKPQEITISRIQTVEDVQHFKSKYYDLRNVDKIKCIELGLNVPFESLYFDLEMLKSQKMIDLMVSRGSLKITSIGNREIENMNENHLTLLAVNLNKIPLGRISIEERSYGLIPVTERMIEIYKKGVEFKVKLDHPMIQRIEFIHKASGVDLAVLKNFIDDCGLEGIVLKGGIIKDIKVPGRNLRSEFVTLVEVVDPRFKAINLRKMNLDNIESVGSYEDFVESSGMTLDTLAKVIEVPESVKSNPKTFKSINSIIAMDGNTILRKSRALSEILGTKLEMSEVFDTDISGELSFTEWFKGVEISGVSLLVSSSGDFVQQLRKHLKRSHLLKLLGSLGGESQIRDTVALYLKASAKIVDLGRSLQNETNDEAKKPLSQLLVSLSKKMEITLGKADIYDLHDGLYDIAGSLSGDPLDPTGLEKYSDLTKKEKVSILNFDGKSEECETLKLTEAGKRFINEPKRLSLFFPKNKADLIALGSEHGWCVDTVGSYYDESFLGKTVLVALCEDSPSIENARILVELAVKKEEKPDIEQVRISSKLGSKHVEAKELIDTSTLIRVIEEAHLEILKNETKDDKKAS
ncbi:hypothetical protein [Bdellovibrio sp. BCCA]|uniref:hypothetical protein n=1 Tax=Bdellovibrio sp. BCCA TaxID=3136281 RepID=UPI0030F0A847